LNYNILEHPSLVTSGLQDDYRRVLKGESIEKKGIVFPVTTGGTGGVFNVRGVPLFRDGEVIGAVMIHEDITDLKGSEKAVLKSEGKYRDLYNNAPDMYVSVDAKTATIIECNQTLIDELEYEKNEIIGRPIFDMYTHDSAEYAKTNVFPKFVKTGSIKNVELQLQRKDGSAIDVSLNVSAVFDEKGNILYSRSIWRDITKQKQAEKLLKKAHDNLDTLVRKRTSELKEVNEQLKQELKTRVEAEKALRESEERLRAILEANPDPVVMYDTEGHPQYLNPAFTEVFGWALDELKGQRIPFVPHDQKEITAAKIKEIYALGKTVRIETQRLTKQGDTIDVIVSAAGIKGPKEKILGMVVNLTDVTEKKKIESQLQRSQKMESLGLLAGGVAHDLNNVLSGFVSYPELLLLELPEDSRLRKPIESMKNSGHRAVAIVQDLLTVARGVATTKEPLNLNDIIREYLQSPEFYKFKEFYPAVTIKTNLHADLLNIAGSQVHIRKVIMNLVSNASEAIKGSGGVVISTVNRYIDRPLRGYDDVKTGEYAVLAVSDDGSGISSEDLERIFEPFYTKKMMGRSGTGLGLAVVWNVVQDHEGYIDFQSTGSGTTFELYFPTSREPIADRESPMPIGELKGAGETILVVDDVETQREIACYMLNTLDYKTKAVSSGEEAVKYLQEHSVDLLLLDMIMEPGINGRETYERIIKIHPNQKAVIVSGFAETDEVRKAQRLGAGRFIKKPLTLEKIGFAIKDELKK
jgi:PAS domain S-box-containing protein